MKNHLIPLTIEDIKDRLKKMVVNNKDILPLRVFSLLVKNPKYDIDNFSQEIEDSETKIDVMKEIVAKMKEPDFDLVWNNTLHQLQTNSPEWMENHTKHCPLLLVPNAYSHHVLIKLMVQGIFVVKKS